MRIFASRRRTDRTPRKANETFFAFLDRTGATYYEPVRDLLESWIDRVPESHRSSLVSALSDSDAKFDSAFWEMYVYTVSTSLGLEVEIHPDVPGTAKHPDFLVHDDVPYYLEAVSVGHRPEALARDRRRAEVEAVLDRMSAQGVTLSFEHHQIGTRQIAADRLRKELTSRLASPVIRSASWRWQAQEIGAARPTKYYEDDGWLLKFEAIPTNGEVPLVGVRGPGRAQGVNKAEHLRRVAVGLECCQLPLSPHSAGRYSKHLGARRAHDESVRVARDVLVGQVRDIRWPAAVAAWRRGQE